MTDMTNEISQEGAKLRKPPRAEFMTYFGLIFVATLPLSILTWILGVARTGSFYRKNPIQSAWSQARIITPMIFNA